MKYSLILAWFVLLVACTTDRPPKAPIDTPKPQSNSNEDLETRARRHVEAQLQIPVTEKYGLQILRASMDGDGKEDAIIAVNRLEHALESAAKNANSAKLAEIGFVGNHNLLFYYDGGLDQLSPPIAVPSSPYLPLEISFASITSAQFQDFVVGYRIRNSAYRAFFTIEKHTPVRYFEWPEFDELGTSKAKAFAFEYVPGSITSRKNIQIYDARIEVADTVKHWNLARPKLIKSNTLLHEFFYLPEQNTYVTKASNGIE